MFWLQVREFVISLKVQVKRQRVPERVQLPVRLKSAARPSSPCSTRLGVHTVTWIKKLSAQARKPDIRQQVPSKEVMRNRILQAQARKRQVLPEPEPEPKPLFLLATVIERCLLQREDRNIDSWAFLTSRLIKSAAELMDSIGPSASSEPVCSCAT